MNSEIRSGQRTKAHWQEYLAHTQRQLWGGHWKSWRVWVIVLLPYALGAAAGWYILPLLIERDLSGERILLALAGMYGALGAWLVNCKIAPKLMKPAVLEQGTFCGQLTLNWNEDWVKTYVSGAEYKLSWSAILRITETKLTLFLQSDQCEAAVIPLNVFDDEKDIADFKVYAEKRSADLSLSHD